MNFYKTSSGERISKREIDKNVKEAKAQLIQNQLNEFGYNFCEQCIKEGYAGLTLEMRILDCAHIESVDSCQKNGRAEKAWDVSNMRILCRYHHRMHDKTNLSF